MYSLSCVFLLHQHFEAATTSPEIIEISSKSLNNDIMSDEQDNDNPTQIVENETNEPRTDDVSSDSTINSIEDDSHFIYDEDSNRLTCIGSNYDNIPQNIIDRFSIKTKILDLSKNHFRSLDSVKNFPNLEELILDDNQLDDTHTSFPKLAHLNTLMLNKNRFQDIYKLVDQLRHAYPMLIYLSLLGNEACPYRIISSGQTSSSNNTDLSAFAQNRLEEEYQRYRHLLIFRISTLKFLDAREIGPDERRIALKLGDILYSIDEVRKSQTQPDDDSAKHEKKDVYTPLPSSIGKDRNRPSVGKLRHTYDGKGSQGNKFLKDVDL
ncbi:unnamed protein product [Adineta steineri]|uniref:Uncharacterized protein n=1 Tax=Adineta steineri TaxID=433720 RepID=A0A814AQX4_9BILA|nr:unnamed protein product [Adineta steineri]